MKATLGLAVGYDCVRVVLVRRGAVAYAAEATVDASVDATAGLADAVAELLAVVPRRRWRQWRRPAVVVTIGPAFAQTRIIGGLPPLEDPRILSRMVREGVGRFFLRNGTALVSTGIRPIEPGRVWAAAFDEPVVRAVIEGCHAARLRVRAIAPAVAVLPAAVEGDRIIWADGPVCAEVSLDAGTIATIRRLPHSLAGELETPRPRDALARVGEEAWRFADAYGAAARDAAPLVLRPNEIVATPQRESRSRAFAAAAGLVVSACAALGAPGLAAEWAIRDSTERLAALAEARNAAVGAEADLRRFSAALDDVAEFDRRRRLLTPILAELTRALPERHAVVALRLDSAGGTIVGIGPRAAGIISTVDNVPALASPAIVGPVTRERVGDQELERVTVRFRLVEPERSAPVDAGGGT